MTLVSLNQTNLKINLYFIFFYVLLLLLFFIARYILVQTQTQTRS